MLMLIITILLLIIAIKIAPEFFVALFFGGLFLSIILYACH